MTTNATAPEAGGAPASTENEIPVQVSTPEPLIVAKDDPAPAAVEPEVPATEEPATGEPEGRKAPPKLPEWAQKKIADAAYEAREASRRAKALEEEIARLKAGTTPAPATAADAQAAQENAPAGGYRSQADFDAAVQAEANRRAAQEVAAREQADFNAACDAAYNAGKGAYQDDFDTAVENLRGVGAMQKDILDIVLAMDDPAKVLFDLGSDPGKAAALLQMTPAKRAAEIAKMAVTATPKAEPTPLSRAPRPVQPVEGSARPNSEPSDADDDATWFAKRNAQLARRYNGGAAA